MPSYNFYCEHCKSSCTEYLSILRRNDEKLCPMCQKEMKRLIGKGLMFNLKGNGFYKSGKQ